MNWILINHPLGMTVPGGIDRKEIPLAIPLVMAGASALSSLWGGKKSAEAAAEAAAKLAAEKAATENERRLMKNRSWTDTSSGQNTLRVLQDQARRQLQGITGAAKVGGATDAAVAREKELLNDKQAEVIAQANANFEDKKDAQDATYRADLSRMTQQQIAADQAKANATAQAAAGVSNSLMQGAVATFQGTKLGQQMMGVGSPGGGGVSAPTDLQSYAARLQAENSIEAMRRNAQAFRTSQLNLMGT